MEITNSERQNKIIKARAEKQGTRYLINQNGVAKEVSVDFQMFGLDLIWKLYENETNEKRMALLNEAFQILACAVHGLVIVPEEDTQRILNRQ